MNIIKTRLINKNQTGKQMNRLVDLYSTDLNNIIVSYRGKALPLSSLNMIEFFDFVKKIPYRQDIKPVEVVSRPAGIIKNAYMGMDCKKKAILIASYLKGRGLKYRLIASSNRPNKQIHHVFPQVNIAGKWLNMDATYSNYKPFQQKNLTRAEILK